jgi:hypothetical protein
MEMACYLHGPIKISVLKCALLVLVMPPTVRSVGDIKIGRSRAFYIEIGVLICSF